MLDSNFFDPRFINVYLQCTKNKTIYHNTALLLRSDIYHYPTHGTINFAGPTNWFMKAGTYLTFEAKNDEVYHSDR